MSTNAVIAISNSQFEMELTAIYVHWDGGQTLANDLDEYHDSWEHARDLVNMGDLSSVSGRDVESYFSRGERWERVKPTEGDLKDLYNNYKSAEYFHIFHDGEWGFLSRENVADIIEDLETEL
jgi:hypothetical protein